MNPADTTDSENALLAKIADQFGVTVGDSDSPRELLAKILTALAA